MERNGIQVFGIIPEGRAEVDLYTRLSTNLRLSLRRVYLVGSSHTPLEIKVFSTNRCH